MYWTSPVLRKFLFFFLIVFNSSILLSATYVVDNSGDTDDALGYTVSDGTNTLRKCIRLANAAAGADIINFGIAGAGPHTITLGTGLPAISDVTGGTTIDASTQAGSIANSVLPKDATSGTPMNGTFKIILTNALASVAGFSVTSNSNIIKGFVIQSVGTNASKAPPIFISGSSNQVLGCILGLDVNGTTASNTNSIGVFLTGTVYSNIVGDGTAAGANIISGNSSYGIQINFSGSGNSIKGNMIGLQKDGESLSGTSQTTGIYLVGGNSGDIGGTNAADANIVSGNTGTGIYIANGSSANVFGNIIGPKASGAAIIVGHTQGTGIYLAPSLTLDVIGGSSACVIGGSSAAYRNVISDNNNYGVYLQGSFGSSTINNTVKGNFIGVAKDGVSYLTGSSQDYGINITCTNMVSVANNVFGGSNPGEGNVISGNTNSGIYIVGAPSSGVITIKGNTIGLQNNGTTVMSSSTQTYGIQISNMRNVVIGGTGANEKNIISGNDTYGIYLTGASATGTLIKGNYIGLQSNGTTAVASSSQDYGVYITTSANSNTIGGTNSGDGNVISGNSVYGVYLESDSTLGNTLKGNVIGPQADGNTYLASHTQQRGIYITSSPNNTIGGTGSFERNYISSNINYGIYFTGATSSGNLIKGNFIGLDKNGTSFITGSTQQSGIYVSVNSISNIIGGTNAGEGNVISGNSTYGIRLVSAAAGGNIIKGNTIGPQANGSTNLTSNPQTIGVSISSSPDNIIGGSAANEKNIISANLDDGIYVAGSTSSGTIIKGNYIGTSSDGNSYITSSSQNYGIYTYTDCPSVAIGGIGSGEGNVISGNGGGTAYGIYFDNGSNYVYGNFIGPKSVGTTALDATSNQMYGIYINNKPNNIIGGSTSAYRNVISDNTLAGIYVTGSSCTGTVIKGNYIGIASNGTSFISGNSQDDGIYLPVALPSGFTIGGTGTGEGNVISGNTNAGINSNISGGLFVYGNKIGCAASGTTAVDASNNQVYGIYMLNSAGITIGGSTLGHRNVISDNRTYGLYFTGSNSRSSVVKGNYIGIAADGGSYITSSSQDYGVYFTNSARSNAIGGTTSGEGNLISGNTEYGIHLNGAVSVPYLNVIYGNIIGPQKDGSTYVTGNLQTHGIYLDRSRNNIIGSSVSGGRNIISANETAGIYITGTSSTGNTIKGNYIGTSSNGAGFITNSTQDHGIYTYTDCAAVTIGGIVAGEGNVISGNNSDGVYLTNTATTASLFRNIIGPAVDGSTLLSSNQTYGVNISSSPNNIIGGSSSAYRNIISANGNSGVYIIGSASTGNQIKGNYIGMASNGTSLIASSAQSHGINSASTYNTIGGTISGEGNLISGQSTNGYGILLSTSNNNKIYGNVIGLSDDGLSDLGVNNQLYGIHFSGSSNNIIGGSTTATRNIISGNQGTGMYVSGSSNNNTITGNYIGIATNGTSFVAGNSQDYGIYVLTSSSGTIIGGTNTGEGNVISGQRTTTGLPASGINLNASSSTIIGNTIGPQANGSTFLTNEQLRGITLVSSANNIIGGTSSAYRNVISSNGEHGIYISGATATGTVIKGNYIGIASNGTSFITSNSQDNGIYFSETAPATTIGGTNTGEGNVISGNGADTAHGIYMNNGGNEVYGNYIGPKAVGTTTLDPTNNQDYGIYINNTAGNIIGGTSSGHRNVISDNTSAGIYITGASATGTFIKGNYVGIATNGTSIIAGNTQASGVYILSSANNNTIGGINSNEGNIVSGNATYGIQLASTSNYVYQNIIGLQANGSSFVTSSAQSSGIRIAGASDNIIGGSTASYRNTISGNASSGISASGTCTGNVIKGNFIGPISAGTSTVAGSDQDHGISFSIAAATANTIGGTISGEGNVISGNADNGIYFVLLTGTVGNYIYQNTIGLQADGVSLLAGFAGHSQDNGIKIDGDDNNIIGGNSASYRNVISDNLSAGILLTASTSTGNVIKGNYIGTTSAGASISGSGQDYGVHISTAKNNQIGTGITADGNIIAYNTSAGIYFQNAGSSGNLISRNLIYGNTAKAINHNSVGNATYAAPTVDFNFTATTVSGTATAGDIIEVFESVTSSSVTTSVVCQSAEVYLGTTTANGAGIWTLTSGFTLTSRGTPIATARPSANNNTSEFGCPQMISLPIDLLFFNATKTNETAVKTYWQTATEINNDYFTVERSANGIEFEEIGMVDGAGNSSSVLSYQLPDNLRANYGLTTLYYRLKQTDFDGKYSYSQIVPVNFDNSSFSGFNIYPNPTTADNINIAISGDANDEVLIIVRDVLGKELYAKAFIIDSNSITIKLSDGFSLASGVYTIAASSNDKMVSKKIVVK